MDEVVQKALGELEQATAACRTGRDAASARLGLLAARFAWTAVADRVVGLGDGRLDEAARLHKLLTDLRAALLQADESAVVADGLRRIDSYLRLLRLAAEEGSERMRAEVVRTYRARPAGA